MVSWVDPAKNATILFDNAPVRRADPSEVPVRASQSGRSWPYAIEQDLSGLNSYYASFPSQVSGYLGRPGIHISGRRRDCASRAGAPPLRLWSGHEVVRPGEEGQGRPAPPSVERTIVAESSARIDFLQTSRSKGGYVATLAQLYELLDSIVAGEFGKGLSAIEENELLAKVGADEARRAKTLFLWLSKLHDYATGKKRFLFPPVLAGGRSPRAPQRTRRPSSTG